MKEFLTDIAENMPKSLVVIFFCLVLFLILRNFSWYPEDNPLEQELEHELKEETGLDIDITP